jgi:hypothetical protein
MAPWTPKTIITTAIGVVTTIATIGGGFLFFEDRYAHQSDLTVSLNSAKNEIIATLSAEVVKNRAVMITTMQREADELEYQITMLQAEGKPVPRHIIDKFKAITRSIEDLER